MRHLIRGIILLALLAGCAGPDAPTGTPIDSPTAAQTASTPPSATPLPSEEPEPTPLAGVPAPGLPYGADEILVAMRESRRPGGVPDQLETREIAAAIAGEIWTLGGDPWATMSIGASCGTGSCLIEVGGAPAGAAGEDLYVFSYATQTGVLTRESHTLLGLPAGLPETLDRVARNAWDGDLDALALASARWMPPPEDGQFLLAYRSGGEEGSPGVDLLLDAADGSVREAPNPRR